MRFLSELILHIETATKICSVALSDSGNCLNHLDKDPDEYVHGEFLTVFIQELFLKSDKNLEDLDAVSVSIGPGSYTGLRIGLAVAKGLCFGLKIPLITIETLDSLLETGKNKHPNKSLCALIDARRMEVYSKMISPSGQCCSEATSTIIDESTFTDFEPFIYFGDGASKLSEIWSARDVLFDEQIKLSSMGQIDEALVKFRSNDFEELAYIKPMYIKDFKVG